MDIKLFDSELKVMGVLWDEGDTTAKHISDVLKEEHEHYIYVDQEVHQKRSN